jgi:sn-glycerol 3-phosphate transport system substrate-binding protein
MIRKSFPAVLATLVLASTAVQAQTEIQFWHSMGGALGDKVSELAGKFNESQKDYKVVATYKGGYPESMTAAIAAYRAGNAPHILQVFEVGTATMMAAKGAIVPISKVMKDADEPFNPKAYLPTVAGYYTDTKGNMLSFPFNSSTIVFYVNKDAYKKAGLDPNKAPKTWKEFVAAADKLKAAGVRLHDRLALVDAHREFLGVAQRPHRHEGKRHGGARHRVQDQLAPARAPPHHALGPREER